MDHAYAEEHDLVESYLGDRLSESEREAFEAHYFACEACLAQLEAAEGFRDGMRTLAAEAAAAHAGIGLLAGLARLSRGRRLALAGALGLAVLAVGFLVAGLVGWNRSLEQRLAEATAPPVAAPVPAPAGDSRVADLEAEVRSLREARSAEHGRLEEELAAARGALAAAEEAAGRPRVNVPVFVLAAVRGGEAGRDPVNRLELPAGADSAVLAVELAVADSPSYRATLAGEGGEIWRADGLVPDGRNQLAVLLPAAMIPPGDYRLTIEAPRAGGPGFPVAELPFRVLSSPRR